MLAAPRSSHTGAPRPQSWCVRRRSSAHVERLTGEQAQKAVLSALLNSVNGRRSWQRERPSPLPTELTAPAKPERTRGAQARGSAPDSSGPPWGPRRRPALLDSFGASCSPQEDAGSFTGLAKLLTAPSSRPLPAGSGPCPRSPLQHQVRAGVLWLLLQTWWPLTLRLPQRPSFPSRGAAVSRPTVTSCVWSTDCRGRQLPCPGGALCSLPPAQNPPLAHTR